MDDAGLSALLHRHASRRSVPGAALGVLQDGEATTVCFGVADVRTDEPVTPRTRFSVGSLTKSMVATVIARLTGQGRLASSDPVAECVSELRGADWARRSTVADLLANRSGLPLLTDLEFGFDARIGQDDAALSRFAGEIGAAGAGPSIWSYTNAGWCVLGRGIETVTDSGWEDAMRRHLFEPLGMTGTAFRGHPPAAPLAWGHEVSEAGAVPVDPLTARAYGPAGTTLVATVEDLLRFAGLHLGDDSLAWLRVPQAEVGIHGWLDSWCSGWAHWDWHGHPVWGWDGLVPGERLMLRFLPDERAAVVFATNGSTGRELYRSLFSELVPALFGIEFPRLRLEPVGPPGDLAPFAGTYGWRDRRMEVTAAAGGLRLSGDDYERREALPLGRRAFLVDPADPDSPAVTFGEFDAAGRPQVLYIMLWGLPRLDG
jgi:CubicO group peptidase (beta-lactamase class C family)